MYLYCICLAAELFLTYRQSAESKKRAPSGFTTQFLHPYYFFSFPQTKERLDEINSPDSWVDARGYRGDGPEAKGNRKLAFLLGGSTAFGHGIQRNSETISSRLNEMQNDYFFVNGGVPSWNSFQELLRFLKQALPEGPALVVTLDGYNDFAVARDNLNTGLPLDAPESFRDLDNFVEDIRSPYVKASWIADYLEENYAVRHMLLVNLRNRLGLLESRPAGLHREFRQPTGADNFSEKVAAVYLSNLGLMHEIADIRGFRFLSFFQPVRALHKSYFRSNPEAAVAYLDYRKKIFSSRPSYLIDLSDMFDRRKSVDDLFLDEMHFNADGAEAVARTIWASLKHEKVSQ